MTRDARWRALPAAGDAAADVAQRFVGLGLDDLLAAVVAARADMVAQMHLAADRLDGERRIGQEVVRAVHAALGSRFLVLLNSHVSVTPQVLRNPRFFSLASGANGDASLVPPAFGALDLRAHVLRTLSFRMPRREREREQDLVLDQRARIDRCRREHDFRVFRVEQPELGSHPAPATTGVCCAIGAANGCRQRWHTSGSDPSIVTDSIGRWNASWSPAIRHAIGAGPAPARAGRPPEPASRHRIRRPGCRPRPPFGRRRSGPPAPTPDPGSPSLRAPPPDCARPEAGRPAKT